MSWRAWYADGAVYSSAWRDMPPDGILGGVTYLEPPYRELVVYGDWYWLADGKIQRRKTHPEWGQYAPPPAGVDPDMLKRSGAVTDAVWARVQSEMMEARAWP